MFFSYLVCWRFNVSIGIHLFLNLQCSGRLGTGMASLTHDRRRQVWDLLNLSALTSERFLFLILLPLRRPRCCLSHFQAFYITVALGSFLYNLHLISGNAETNGVPKQPGWETPFLLHFYFMQLGRLSLPPTLGGHGKGSANAWHGGSARLRIHTPIPTQE